MEAEAIVVGAGPAGSTTARELAARGVEVLLLDRARFPRDKPCGGGVTIRCDALLPFSLEAGRRGRHRRRRDPVPPRAQGDAHARRAADLHDASAIASITSSSQQAQEAGAEFRDGQRVRDVRRLGGGEIEVSVGNGTVPEVHRARVVIGADGANGVVGTSLGYEHAEESAVALEGNFPFPDGVPRGCAATSCCSSA